MYPSFALSLAIKSFTASGSFRLVNLASLVRAFLVVFIVYSLRLLLSICMSTFRIWAGYCKIGLVYWL